MSPIVIDKEKLIKEVHERPALWDKYSKDYKQQQSKKEAWREICHLNNRNFDNMDPEEQEEYARLVIRVWTRIRDAWLKNLNEKASRKPALRPYKYHKHLLFLKKVVNKCDYHEIVESENEKHNALDGNESESDNSAIFQSMDESVSETAEPSFERIKPYNIATVMIPEPVSETHRMQEDRHLAFFKSIQPTVVSFNDDQFLEFQAGVISLLRRIKSHELDQPHTSSTVPGQSLTFDPILQVKRSPSTD